MILKQCLYCHEPFNTEDKRQKYCCIDHAYKDRKSHKVTVACTFCGKEKQEYPSRIDGRNFFCNSVCHNSYQRLMANLPNTYASKRVPLVKTCRYCGKNYSTCATQQIFCSNACRVQYLTKTQVGANHPAWKGGITPERRTVEGTKAYQRWRINVYRRDKFRCVMCGSTKCICAHHIRTFSEYPELRTEVDNGITLCRLCHNKTYSKEPTYEVYFINALSFLKDFYSREVRLA